MVIDTELSLIDDIREQADLEFLFEEYGLSVVRNFVKYQYELLHEYMEDNGGPDFYSPDEFEHNAMYLYEEFCKRYPIEKFPERWL